MKIIFNFYLTFSFFLETDRFYLGMRMLGSNFSLMASLFKRRDRTALKNKYDRERKINPAKLDDAMFFNHLSFDRSKFPEETGTIHSIRLFLFCC